MANTLSLSVLTKAAAWDAVRAILRKFVPQAIVEKGLAIVGSRVDSSENTLKTWADA